jgi:hypothetical protein
VTIATAYILGRVIFAFGYVFGTLVGKPILRSPGFSLNISTTIAVYLLCSDIDIFKHIP